MLLNFNENNIYMTFEITDDKNVYLLHCSLTEQMKDIDEKTKKFYPIAEIQISGENQDDHHGAKHTVTWGSFNLKYESHAYYDNDYGKKLEFVLVGTPLKATVNYQFYTGVSAVRSWVEVENISDSDVGLEYVSSFSLTGINEHELTVPETEMALYIPHNSWVREVTWEKKSLAELGYNHTNRFSLKRISASNTGTWSTKEYLAMGVFENGNGKTTYMWQIENNGSWNWEISDIPERLYLKLSGPSEAENHWYKELKPGEIFTGVKSAVAFGNCFDSALASMTCYRRAIVRQNRADSYLPVIFNDYMNCLWADPTTEKMIPVIDKAAEVGAEYYCMDAGWYADGTWWETVGEWQPCSWRFPGGIKEVFDYIKSKGMIPGIWLEIEVMGINCPIAKEFEDECFFMRHGKRVIDHGRYQLDFRHPKVREYVTSVVDRVVGEYGVGYIKMDYNIDGGIGTEINASSFGDGLLEHNRAYLAWIEEIMNKYPDLVIENCSSGGMRLDYGMLSLHPIQSVTDQSDYRHMSVIAANLPTAVLPEQGAIWSYPKADGDENETTFNMVNAMLSRMHLSGEICKISEKQLEMVKDGVRCYKALRNKIKEFIPFYPNGLNSAENGWASVGYKTEKEAYLAIWRCFGENNTMSIPFNGDGCDSEIVYPFESKCVVAMAENNISVTLPDKYSAVILKITEK